MCRVPLAQGGRAGAGVRRLEHVAVIWQRVGASHRRLSHAQQVLAGRQGQCVVFGAEISLRGKKPSEERRHHGVGRGEVPRNASDSHCNQYGTMGMHIVSMYKLHEWIYQEAIPLILYCQ